MKTIQNDKNEIAMNTFGVRFFIKKTKLNNGTVPIYARITVNKQSVDLSLKRRIPIDKWNSRDGKIKSRNKEDQEITAYLQQVSHQLYVAKEQLEKEHKMITAITVRSRYTGEDEKAASLLELIDYHNTEMKEDLRWGTLKNYYTTQGYIKEFLISKLKRDDIFLKELNYKFLIDFEKFLKTHQPKDHHKPCGQNTAMKHIERLRKMINLAINIEWIDKDPFSKFVPKFNKTERGYLTKDELELIQQKDFTIQRLSQVRDLFIFSCYTGLSYSEVFDLEPNHIVKGIDGEWWIEGQRKKSGEFFAVPLLSEAIEILNKYKDDVRSNAMGKALPVLSNQKLNSYLKEIADVCGIQKNITFHLARHTFATTVTLSNGVPLETVGKMLGHSSLRTTQIYAKVVRSKISGDMQALKNKLRGDNQSNFSQDTA